MNHYGLLEDGVTLDRAVFLRGEQQGPQVPMCIGCAREPQERLLDGAFVCTRCRDQARKFISVFEIDTAVVLRGHVLASSAYLAICATHAFPFAGALNIYIDRARSIERAGGPAWL